jgi:hypothetical protein
MLVHVPVAIDEKRRATADRSGYNLSAYVLSIHVHIYNSLINMG